jgi:hypothetical protein
MMRRCSYTTVGYGMLLADGQTQVTAEPLVPVEARPWFSSDQGWGYRADAAHNGGERCMQLA